MLKFYEPFFRTQNDHVTNKHMGDEKKGPKKRFVKSKTDFTKKLFFYLCF